MKRPAFDGSSEPYQTDAEVVADLAARAALPSYLDHAVVPFVVLETGQQLQIRTDLLENPLEDPGRIRAAVDFPCVESFVSYVMRFRDEAHTTVFANETKQEVTAYLDYHAPGSPSRVTHSARLALKQSRSWWTWINSNKKQIQQAAFAEFLEDNILDIVQPDSSSVLEACRHLEAKKNVSFTSGINVQNGGIQFKYDEDIEAKGKGAIVIPDSFVIQVAPFERTVPVQIPARLRYRITDGKLFFFYVLAQPEKVVENAFADVVATLAKGLDTDPLFGSVAFK